MKYYVTESVLYFGVRLIEAEVSPQVPDTLHVTNPAPNETGLYFGEGMDWHRTWESAQKRARAVQARRIHMLTNEIERLRNRLFDRDPALPPLPTSSEAP